MTIKEKENRQCIQKKLTLYLRLLNSGDEVLLFVMGSSLHIKNDDFARWKVL